MIENRKIIDGGERSTQESTGSFHEEGHRPLKDETRHSLVRVRKSIVVNASAKNRARIDENVISPRYYSSFNYWLLPKDQSLDCLTLGVTSPNSGDGKTVVASNLAVSFALANGKNTLLVDLNTVNPSVHKVFDVPLRPGVLEALHDMEIHIAETPIRNLSVLSFGEVPTNTPIVMTGRDGGSEDAMTRTTLGLEYLPGFRDILYSLQQSFDVVIFDLPPANRTGLPGLYIKQIDGIIVVLRSGQTRKEEIDRVVSQVDESHIRGFVFNRVGDEFSE